MDFAPLLQEKVCSCGKTHSCSIKTISIGSGVLAEMGTLTEGFRSIVLAADSNTYALCGGTVCTQLGSRLQTRLVYQRHGLLIPDEAAIRELEACVTEGTDLIIGIGSGVIQDLCKYVSFRHGLPYHIIATAPSMDGYASTGAALILEGMKVTISCHVPQVILADVDILKNAPMELIQAGYGDILGKFSCLSDWRLSALIRGEYFCQYVHDLMYGMLQQTKDLGPRLLQRETAAVQQLMEALVGAGVAMALVGNSRPASGSEHHLSHFFEITGILDQTPYLSHGLDVAFSSVCTQRIREQLLAMEAPPTVPEKDPAQKEADIRRIYTAAANGVLALQEKVGFYREDRMPIYREKWLQIRDLLSQTPSSEQLIGYLKSVGLDMEAFRSLYGEAKIADGMKYAKDLKDRFTVLWLYYDLMEG